MNTFSWLLVGHLIGDWLLQNDWMAKGKRQGLFTLAGVTHFAVYTAAIMGLLWLFDEGLRTPVFYLRVSLIIFVSHWLIDATRLVEGWMRFYRQGRGNEIVRVVIDQTLHLLVLVLLAVVFLVN